MKIYRKEGRFTKKRKRPKLSAECSKNTNRVQELTPLTARPAITNISMNSTSNKTKQKASITSPPLNYFLPINNLRFNFGYMGEYMNEKLNNLY